MNTCLQKANTLIIVNNSNKTPTLPEGKRCLTGQLVLLIFTKHHANKTFISAEPKHIHFHIQPKCLLGKEVWQRHQDKRQ